MFDRIPVVTSFQQQWQQQPLILRSNPTSFRATQHIFRFDDLDLLLYSSRAVHANFSWRGGTPLSPEDFSLLKLTRGQDNEWWSGTLPMPKLNVEQASLATNRGFSLVLNKIDVRWPSVRHAAQSLTSVTGLRTSTNLYLSPPASQGFEAHFDAMDVYVVQLHGTKRWTLYMEPFLRCPRQDQTFKPTSSQLVGKRRVEVDLHPGDVLYLPAGFVHEARVVASASMLPSLHLSFGTEVDVAFRWEGLLHFACRQQQHITLLLESSSYSKAVSREEKRLERAMCHASVSYLATMTKDGTFGKVSMRFGTAGFSSSSSSISFQNNTEWSTHIRHIVTIIEKFLVLEDVLLHWEEREELVAACWRCDSNRNSRVERGQEKDPPPPTLKEMKSMRKKLKRREDKEKMIQSMMSMVRSSEIMGVALDVQEKERVDRTKRVEQIRDRTLNLHKKYYRSLNEL